jgi:hypothetical protein
MTERLIYWGLLSSMPELGLAIREEMSSGKAYGPMILNHSTAGLPSPGLQYSLMPPIGQLWLPTVIFSRLLVC